jgi:hypothetical protein
LSFFCKKKYFFCHFPSHSIPPHPHCLSISYFWLSCHLNMSRWLINKLTVYLLGLLPARTHAYVGNIYKFLCFYNVVQWVHDITGRKVLKRKIIKNDVLVNKSLFFAVNWGWDLEKFLRETVSLKCRRCCWVPYSVSVSD